MNKHPCIQPCGNLFSEPDLVSAIIDQMERAALLLGLAAEALKAHAQDVQSRPIEQNILEAPLIQNGKINGTLRLNSDERSWSS